MKKFTSLVLAAVLCLALAVPAFAAEDYDVRSEETLTEDAEYAWLSVYAPLTIASGVNVTAKEIYAIGSLTVENGATLTVEGIGLSNKDAVMTVRSGATVVMNGDYLEACFGAAYEIEGTLCGAIGSVDFDGKVVLRPGGFVDVTSDNDDSVAALAGLLSDHCVSVEGNRVTARVHDYVDGVCSVCHAAVPADPAVPAVPNKEIELKENEIALDPGDGDVQIDDAGNYVVTHSAELYTLHVNNKYATLTIPEGVTLKVNNFMNVASVYVLGTLDVSEDNFPLSQLGVVYVIGHGGGQVIGVDQTSDTFRIVKADHVGYCSYCGEMMAGEDDFSKRVERSNGEISWLGSTLSEGNMAIIVGVAAAVVFGLGGFLVGKKNSIHNS